MSYRVQNYGILVEGPVHRSSSDQLPPTLVSDDSYYRTQPPSTEGHNVSYASYASYSTMAPTRTPESLMGYQGQPMPSAQVPSNSHYGVRGHNPAEVNIGSSGGTPFSTHTTDPFELPYYQAVAPESRPIDSADMYHHQYPQGYGAVVTSPPSVSSTSAGSSRKQKHAASRSRKSRNSQQVLSPGSTSSTSNNASSSRSSRLRSASRTSKNTHHNPPASAEEQKSRETHNQVEKQYRNRLNAHFESLLDALPETMQAGEGEDGDEGAGAALDLTDRRVSKAEVLDMARRHIQALERECAALEGERDELRNNMARLRWLFGRCEGADGFNERLDFPDTGPMP